ncbi:uncharacterized protein LOC122654153 [Telopea speciosissima]|uniref:uncharacterized protein LOC122654153 n=1 Tax=Telopea speciosissima TaxID=54955 RepID=UPI001CC574B2|nr:uncharacterized protein LOC122654153 [Telopea speciosissima]
MAGIGGVCRSNTAQFICAFSEGIGWNYALVAEALAARRALLMARQFQMKHVMLESDNLLIVNLLKGQTRDVPWRITTIISDCRSLFSYFDVILFEHVLREANSVADSLATKAPESQHSMCWLSIPPPFISPLLFADASGTLFPR